MALRPPQEAAALAALARRRLTVKFDVTDRDELPYVAGPELDARLLQLAGTDFADFQQAFPGAAFLPLVPNMDPAVIDELNAAAWGDPRSEKAVNFFAYYMVIVPSGSDPDAMVAALRNWDLVASVVVDPGPPSVAGCVHPEDDPLAGEQLYLGEAPLGLDVEFGWARSGGAGEGQAVAVVELDWFLDHEDLPSDRIHAPLGDSIVVEYDEDGPYKSEVGSGVARDNRAHGTKTLGVLAGVDNDKGVVGIAPEVADIAVSSTWRPCGVGDPADSRGCFEWKASDTAAAVDVWSHPEQAVYDAVAWLKATKPGSGVLLIEVQDDLNRYDSDIPAGSYVPLETREFVHDLVTGAVAAGITVVSAAGNGGQELKSGMSLPTASGTTWVPDLVNPADIDSGSIMVGAANPPAASSSGVIKSTVAPGSPAYFTKRTDSNHGDRVNCFAWGNHIRTTDFEFETPGDVGLDTTALTDGEVKAAMVPHMSVYGTFSQTSGASAIIAGFVLVLQGLLEECGASLTPGEIRDMLEKADFGTTSWAIEDVDGTTEVVEDTDGTKNKIGFMPDLKKILESASGFSVCTYTPDLYVRDNKDDDGGVHTGPLSGSPDIIVRRHVSGTSVIDVDEANARWGEGSGNEDETDLSDDHVVAGEDHHLWVRVRNRGNIEAQDVEARVYWSPPATLPVPSLWLPNLIGTATLDRVCRGRELTVSPPIDWPGTVIPAAGHYCFIAILDHPDDPQPPLTDSTFSTFAGYMDFVRDENNVAWRNFNVKELTESGTSMFSLPFLLPGAFDEDLGFEVDVLTNAPVDVGLTLHMPAEIHGALGVGVGHPVDRGLRAAVDVRPRRGRFQLGGGVLPRLVRAEDAPELALKVRVPPLSGRAPFEVAVRQLRDGVELGRITWRFVGAGRRRRRRPPGAVAPRGGRGKPPKAEAPPPQDGAPPPDGSAPDEA